ncbi:hypothetical protein ACH3XW_47435 [Acanthocheilonema viteae]
MDRHRKKFANQSNHIYQSGISLQFRLLKKLLVRFKITESDFFWKCLISRCARYQESAKQRPLICKRISFCSLKT